MRVSSGQPCGPQISISFDSDCFVLQPELSIVLFLKLDLGTTRDHGIHEKAMLVLDA